MTQIYSEDANEIFGLDSFKKSWFTENGSLMNNFAWSIHIKKILHHERSPCQDILVFDSEEFGRCLALDDYIQCVEEDEFVLNEMFAFLSLNSHPHPKKVLIEGGGNAGIAREATKHPSVDSIVLCESDEILINVCQKHVPFIAEGLESAKLKLVKEDVVEYLQTSTESFDIIITDLPDSTVTIPDLFKKPHFKTLKAALNPGGFLVSQAECFWFDLHKSKELLDECRKVFPVVDYATAFVPSLPGGQRGILLCGTSQNTNFREPINVFTSQSLKSFKLRYYTPDVHRAAFALPLSIREDLGLETELNFI